MLVAFLVKQPALMVFGFTAMLVSEALFRRSYKWWQVLLALAAVVGAGALAAIVGVYVVSALATWLGSVVPPR